MSTHDDLRASPLPLTSPRSNTPPDKLAGDNPEGEYEDRRHQTDYVASELTTCGPHESPSASKTVYRDDYALMAAAHQKTNMLPQRSATLAAAAPTKANSPHKPFFRIQLPTRVTLSGVAIDGSFERSGPLIRLPILTPPDEHSQPAWRLPSASRHGSFPIDSTPPLDLEAEGSAIVCVDASSRGEDAADMEAAHEKENILAASVKLAVEKLVVATPYPRTIRAVHQLSPSPIQEDDEKHPVSVLRSILDHLFPAESNHSNYVLVTHAIPEKYFAKSVTNSPATTPGALVSQHDGQDYFSTRNLVNTTVVLCDRDAITSPTGCVPASPGMASTPYSIDIALYQRIIPPATEHEVRNLFSAGAGSALADRLTELAPSGRLVLVYPTQAGCRTFQREYLNPALAPILRSVVIGRGLSGEACSAVAASGVDAAVPDYPAMHAQLDGLLQDMAAEGSRHGPASWSILSSGTHSVVPSRKIWQQWWMLQETPRVRQVVDYYFRQLNRRSFFRDEHFTSNELTRQVMAELAQRGLHEVETDKAPIEVAVFVVERSA